MRWWPLLFVLGCKGRGDTDAIEPVFSSCDPLDEALCALPWPSSFYLAEADTVTGYRVAIPDDALPTNIDGVQVNPARWNEKDGFSIYGPLLVFFPDVSIDGVISHTNLDAYLADDARTVIINTSTGERVPHFVELDVSGEDPDERLLMLQPVVPLDRATRYVVGIRGLTTSSGGAVASSAAFAALRDGTETDTWDVEGRRDHFDDVVFPALEAEGFARGELQLAWDFVTMSRDSALGRMDFVRDDGLARLPEGGPAYEVTSTVDGDCAAGEAIGRTVYGTMTVPLYTETDDPGTLLTRDDAGMPYANGETEVPFTVRVPCTLVTDPRPAPLLQYGHGLLGSRDEVEAGWLGEFLNESGWVAFAVDWKGMSTKDSGAVAMMVVGDLSNFAIVPERSHQGFLEFLVAMRLMSGAFATDAAVTFPDGEGNPVAVIDPTRRWYYGISQGGIMGGAYLAMSPDIDRGVLGVPGMPYSLLLTRSHDFEDFFRIFKSKFDDHRDIALLISLMEMLWEPGEAGGWAHDMTTDDDGIAAKQVLIQAAIGDAQVTTLGAHVMARAYGASTVAPETRPVWGVTEQAPGFVGSALVEWAYTDVPDEPIENLPPEASTDTHECPRREPSGQQQIRTFLETGVVEQYCDGTCTSVRADVCG